MKTLQDIVASNGGMEWLPRRSPLLISIDPYNHFTIEYAGLSPNDLPSVRVFFFNRERGPDPHRRVWFEVTDLGWLPYYLFNKIEPMVLDIYELNTRGRVKRTNRTARSQLVQICQNLDEELEVLLSPDDIVLT
jgi:hypothetical protein